MPVPVLPTLAKEQTKTAERQEEATDERAHAIGAGT